MARKKQEIALQLEIETQEQWEELLAKEGLIVIDVYQEWAGPCKAMVSNFRKMRNELSDDLLRFAAAKADTVDSLERYRGKCQPCFLFYAGGSLVAVVRGANAPLLSQAVIMELKNEHKVLKGEAERIEIRDPAFAHLDVEKSTLDESETEKPDDSPKVLSKHAATKPIAVEIDANMEPREVTVALLKPDIVKEGKADEVIEKMKEAGIEVLKHEERQLTDEEARDFYGHLKDEPFFDELVEFMCSGPSHVLLLSKPDTGKGIVEEWRQLIGPTSVEDAKESAPESLRAQYGTREMINALHGSDSHQSAIRELAFFFPEYQVPMVAKKGSPTKKEIHGVQRTLALIRPDALAEHKDAIIERINEAGFKIALQKEIQLSKEQAEGFYSEHKDQPYYEELVTKMTSGPVLALGLARHDAITEWRKLLGPATVSEAKEKEPHSLRAQFSVDGTEVNMLHGSDSMESAEKDLDFFFPVEQTVAVIKPDAYDNKDTIIEKIKEAGFHVAARKETTLTKEMASMLYKQNEEKEYFGDLVDHMTSGPTLFMVLTKEDAVEGWRGVIGPTDPTAAKDQAPDSLRAQFGSDIKANAVHGSSTADNAKEIITGIFGVVEFDKTGNIDMERSNTGKSTINDGVEVEAKQGEPEPEKESGESQSAADQAEGQDAQAAGQPAATEETPAGEEAPAGDAEPATGDSEPADGGAPADGEAPAEGEVTADGEAPAKDEATASQPAAADETKPESRAGSAAAPADTPAEAGDEKPAEATEDKPPTEETSEDKPAVTDEGAEEKPAEAAEEEKPAEAAEEKPADAGEESKPAEAEEAAAEEESKPAEAEEESKPAEDSEEKPAVESSENQSEQTEETGSQYTEGLSDEDEEEKPVEGTGEQAADGQKAEGE